MKTSQVVELSPSPDRADNANENASQSKLEDPRLLSSSRSLKKQQPNFRLSIDFGTKCTSIACAKGPEKDAPIFLIEEFPENPMPDMAGTQVPTEIAYFHKHTKKGRQDSKRILYGYEIQSQRENPDETMKEIGHVTNIKLLLDKSPHLKHLRKSLMELLKQLRDHKVITKNEEVIIDLLVFYLRHAKDILQRHHGLRANQNVEITFCTPVCWTPSSNAIMTACLQKAMKRVDLGVDHSGVCNLFMVNEAEAGGTHVIAVHFRTLRCGEVFLLLDCGGGTTDVGVYEIGHQHPFRLGKEVVPATGVVCGSGDLNQRFREFAIQKLKDAQYTEKSKVPIESLIDSEIMPLFERRMKRAFSLKDKIKNKKNSYPFPLRGLQKSKSNGRVKANSFVLSFEDMERFFMPSLKTISDLMEKQINKAMEHQTQIDKVILIGGFGDSPALKDYIADAIETFNQQKKTTIELIVTPPTTGAAGVARGALMRAQDKEHGPEKIPCQSIGIYHHIRNEPERYSDEVLHQTNDWTYNKEDGDYYIENTIRWIIKAGHGKFESVHVVDWNDLHIFTPAHRRSWLAEYELLASDTCIEDYFIRLHAKNYGKTHEIGKVTFELFDIKQHMELQTAEDEDDGQDRYEITVRFEMRVIDKHVDFYAHWPAEGPPRVTVKGTHQHINLTAAFKPGTV